MPPPPLLSPGSRLAGYQIVELVGRGGMGEVYRAKQLSMDREVALKVLSPRLAKQDPSFAQQFVAEARAAGALNHPNIVAVHDVSNAPAPEGCNGLAAGELVHFFSMEFITGETVKDVIERLGAVDAETVALVMRGMVEALGYAEANRIVHRDVKPDNIMLPTSGGMKLADLGLAQQMGTEEAVAERDGSGRAKVVGTPLYMAPEQAQAKPVDHRTDQYALGATLFHMLTGRPPYQGDSAKAIMRAHCFSPIPDPTEINPQVAPPWRTICMRLMAKLPDDRYATSAELRTAIKEASRWRPAPTAATLPRRSRRTSSPWLGITIVVAIAIAATWFVFVWLPGQRPAQPPQPPPQQPPPEPAPPKPDTHADPGPASDPAKAARARAEAALKALPSDAEKALAQVDKLLADPAMAAARNELLARRTALLQAIEERHRNGLRALLDEAEKAIEAGKLRVAHTTLDKVPASEEWPRGRRQALLDRLGAAERNLEQHLAAATAAAKDDAGCNTVKTEIAGCELLDSVRALLQQHLEERRAALAAQALLPDPAIAIWNAIGERLEPLRASMPYSAFADACPDAGKDLQAPEHDQFLQLAQVAACSERVETALRLYLPTALPKVDARFGNRSGTFILTRLEKDQVWFRLVDIPAESRADRATAVLPWANLAAAAMAKQGKPDPQALAAFLWYWRQPEAPGAIAKLGDDPVAQAVALYERRTRPIDIPGVVSRKDKDLQVDYPFASTHDKELLGAWSGTGASLTDRGMRWTVDTAVSSRRTHKPSRVRSRYKPHCARRGRVP